MSYIGTAWQEGTLQLQDELRSIHPLHGMASDRCHLVAPSAWCWRRQSSREQQNPDGEMPLECINYSLALSCPIYQGGFGALWAHYAHKAPSPWITQLTAFQPNSPTLPEMCWRSPVSCACAFCTFKARTSMDSPDPVGDKSKQEP